MTEGLRQLDVFTTSAPEIDVNTKLLLINDEGELLHCSYNTPGFATAHARLLVPDLPVGDYFLRVGQENNGQTIRPIENYELVIRLSPNSTDNLIDLACIPEDIDIVNNLFPGSSTLAPIIAPIIVPLLLD